MSSTSNKHGGNTNDCEILIGIFMEICNFEGYEGAEK
jgi:hypothetical protein